MSTKSELRGALTSLSQTLTARADDASDDADVFLRWFGTKQTVNATLGRANHWSALRPQSAAYAAPIAALVKATNQLATVSEKPKWLSALDAANLAVSSVGALLDHPPAA